MIVPRFEIVQNTAAKDLEAFSEAAQRAVDRVIHAAGKEMLTEVQRGVPRLTGELARGYVIRTNVGFALVGTDLFRARFSEFGTKRGVRGGFVVHAALEGATRRLPEEITAAIEAAI